MPSRHFAEWQAYYRMEPFGAWRDNYHAALIASTIANVNRGANTQPIQPSIFMYEDPADIRDRRDREMLAWIESKVRD
jgi:Protein of unknown function (DUF4035)